MIMTLTASEGKKYTKEITKLQGKERTKKKLITLMSCKSQKLNCHKKAQQSPTPSKVEFLYFMINHK